jgi:hypothetical protein
MAKRQAKVICTVIAIDAHPEWARHSPRQAQAGSYHETIHHASYSDRTMTYPLEQGGSASGSVRFSGDFDCGLTVDDSSDADLRK